MWPAHLPDEACALAAVPGDPLASVDEPPTTSTVACRLAKEACGNCHGIVTKLFFSCCGSRPFRARNRLADALSGLRRSP